MRVSVVIPTKNRYKDLVVTLQNICCGTRFPDELLIIDQTAEDQWDALKREIVGCGLNINYMHRPEINGLIEARNFGLKQSTGDVVLLLDDDITVFPDFFDKLYSSYEENPDMDAVCAVNVKGEETLLPVLLLKLVFRLGPFWDNMHIMDKFYKRFNKPVKAALFKGGYMSCKRAVYETIEFDRSLKGHVFVDDIDFSYRASQQFNLYVSPFLRVIHRGGFNPLYDIERADYLRVHSRIFFFDKNIKKTLLNYAAFYWLMFGTLMASVGRSVARRSMKPLRGFVKGLKSVS